MGRKRVTIADVAAKAGVDPGLVSKVLNNRPGFSIRETTRQRVHDAAHELDYRPSMAARSLRTSKTGAIGVLLPAFTNPIWSEILDAAESEADRRGYTLLAGIAGTDPQTGDRRPSRFLDLARSGSVDGLLVASTLQDSDLKAGFEGIPWLHINRRPDVSRRHLVLDDTAGVATAAEHLIDLGHTKIGYLSGPLDTDSGRRRLTGFKQAMTSRGLSHHAFVESTYELSSGAQAMNSLVDRSPDLTGIVCASFATAAGAVAAAQVRGISIPEQLSIISVHDIEMAAAFGPPLTTVRMPLEELGRRGVELLLDNDANVEIDEMITSPIAVVERRSTAPPPR